MIHNSLQKRDILTRFVRGGGWWRRYSFQYKKGAKIFFRQKKGLFYNRILKIKISIFEEKGSNDSAVFISVEIPTMNT